MLEFPRWKVVMVVMVTAFFALTALPNVLPPAARAKLEKYLPNGTVPLGLDLRGGSHLLLELDFATYKREHFANLRDSLRDELRMLRGAHHAMIQREEDLPLLSLHGRKHRHGGPQRPVHPGGALMLGRTPHAVVDVRGRCDVTPSERKTAAALRRGVFGAGGLAHGTW